MKRVIGTCVMVAALTFSGASIANAAEVNGNGEDIPAPGQAASECVYSGLDTADSIEEQPEEFNDDALAERGNQSPGGVDRYHGVQNYGIFAQAGIKDVVPSPGVACRGN